MAVETDAVELSVVEQAKLENLEVTIAAGLQSFVDVGTALMQIREEKLWRGNFENFEAYCRNRWGFSQWYAYKVEKAASVVNALDNCPKPETESQARPLTKLETPEEQRAAWQEALDTAPDGKVTAAHVEQVVAKWRSEPTPEIVYEEPVHGICTDLEELIAAGKTFGTIYADPPWQYDNKATRANAEGHYAGTMSVEQIRDMPICELAADDAHCHLWTTNAFLRDAFDVLHSWGFEYRSVFVWVKPQMGIGNYWRVSHEFMLLGIRGDAKRFNDRSLKSWAEFDRRSHSEKPDEVRGFIERVSPGPFLELFGRKEVANWTVFGNQVEPLKRSIA